MGYNKNTWNYQFLIQMILIDSCKCIFNLWFIKLNALVNSTVKYFIPYIHHNH